MSGPERIHDPTNPVDEFALVAKSLIDRVSSGELSEDDFKRQYWELCGFTDYEGEQIDFLSQKLGIPPPLLTQHFQSTKFDIAPSLILEAAERQIDEASDAIAREKARATYDALEEMQLRSEQ